MRSISWRAPTLDQVRWASMPRIGRWPRPPPSRRSLTPTSNRCVPTGRARPGWPTFTTRWLKSPRLRARNRLKALAETERHHAQAWAELLASCGLKVSERRPLGTARVLATFARVVGIGPALALAGVAEGQVLRSYLSQVSTVSNQQAQGVLRRVLPEELDHQSPDEVAERDEDSRSPVIADEEWHGGGAESIRNVIYGVNDG